MLTGVYGEFNYDGEHVMIRTCLGIQALQGVSHWDIQDDLDWQLHFNIQPTWKSKLEQSQQNNPQDLVNIG